MFSVWKEVIVIYNIAVYEYKAMQSPYTIPPLIQTVEMVFLFMTVEWRTISSNRFTFLAFIDYAEAWTEWHP